jgi:two-component system chemotaxis sensor kinase CheA
VRLPTSRFDPFWSSAVHLLRNMLDHGIESPAVRRKAGKPEVGTLSFRSSSAPDHYRLEFSDDGRGIDWDKVRASVAEERRSTVTQANLEELLLAGGISTASAVTEVSGRGIGLSDVARRCEDLGGSLSLESVRGCGTKFVCIFPKRENGNSLAPPTRGRAVRLSAGPAGAE